MRAGHRTDHGPVSHSSCTDRDVGWSSDCRPYCYWVICESWGTQRQSPDSAPVSLPHSSCSTFTPVLLSPHDACQVGSATFHSRFRDEGPREVNVTHLKSNMGCLSTIPGRANTLPFATLPSFLARYRHHESITGLFPPSSGCTSASSSTQPFWHLGPTVQSQHPDYTCLLCLHHLLPTLQHPDNTVMVP